MKPDSSEYNKTTITCACGAVYHVGSTKKTSVWKFALVHPFFTGVQKIVDTAGRVEKFSEVWLLGRRSTESEAKSRTIKQKHISAIARRQNFL